MEDTAPRRNMAFRRKGNSPPPSPEESRRQSDVVRSAWRHFGESGPVIAFLNTCQPLHLAIESDEGLGRVEALLNQVSLKLNRIGRP